MLPPTAFGVQPRWVSAEAALVAMGPGGIGGQLDALFALARRDAAIAWASGRWRPGRADPDHYVPGDVVALRAFAVTADLARVAGYRQVTDTRERSGDPGQHQVWETAVNRSALCLADTRALFEAVPHYLDADAAVGILASRPPDPGVVGALRLPHPRIAVYFGRVMELGGDLHDWPRAWDHDTDLVGRPTDVRTGMGDLRALGGGIEGVVLTEAAGGGLADEVLWLISANPDPTKPGSSALDRFRTTVWGRLSSARLAHVAHNLAATVSWAEWRQPERHLHLPDEPESRGWRKAVRRGEFRRHEPRGAAAGVRVLDVARTPVADRVVRERPGDVSRSSPATHLRRAHWRQQPVGPGLSERRLVRVPATVVNPGATPLGPVVYRVPPPEAADKAAAASPEADVTVAADRGFDLRTIDLPGPAPGFNLSGFRPPQRPMVEPPYPDVMP
ncbi:MAG: hypothetical protein M3396_04295 [Actinomycetota bacterium]|nr:hypothetical protein [Actinomycetota bacterium]